MSHDLREAVERYKLLFDSNPQPMWVYDFQILRIVAVDGTAFESYGYTPDAATYQAAVDAGWHFIQKPLSHDVLKRAVREALLGGPGSGLVVG